VLGALSCRSLLLPGVQLQRKLAGARERCADALWRAGRRSSEWGRRLRALSAERWAASSLERVAAVWWLARQRSVDWVRRLRAFRADHRNISAAVLVGVFLVVALGGTGAAFLAASGNADVVAVNYVGRYVTVTGPGATQTYRVIETHNKTVTEKTRGRTIVRRRVVKGPGGLTTLRELVPVAGPGETVTVAGPTKTVTVKETVTQTQVTTETVIVPTEVTITVTTTPGP
jgi:hypothetical protein